ncbi:acetyl-CoA carboxylase biotin carboxyl carrier protein subunit [archaeon]|jgi:biotin carboxyl carrier protein|nr:acetyl-CoA carboxylase biotin carboxyl carrier protein subunit [archaeon]MDP6548031.1 biotin/lipoyl-containing protein [Candidatus Woesearchaeota archaeon]|tara:strand:+ start:23055 stop:23444 length:390 start_codon:yes stop_codon:yes gene_type:complete
MEKLTIKVDGKEYDVRVEETNEGKILVHCGDDVYQVDAPYNKEASIFNKVIKKEIEEKGKSVVTAPLPGTIYDVKVKKGDKVKEGQSLIKLIAMKMENDITAPKPGTIKEVKVKKNDNVNKDDILLIIA